MFTYATLYACTRAGVARPVNLTTPVMQQDDLDLLILYKRTTLHRFRGKAYARRHLTKNLPIKNLGVLLIFYAI